MSTSNTESFFEPKYMKRSFRKLSISYPIIVTDKSFGLQIINQQDFYSRTALDIAVLQDLSVIASFLKAEGGKTRDEVIENIVQNKISGRMYHLLSRTIERKKFKSFKNLLNKGFDPSGTIKTILRDFQFTFVIEFAQLLRKYYSKYYPASCE